MTLKTLFDGVQLSNVRIGPRWASFEFSFNDADRNAAWELYVEMLTRIVTQPLPLEFGDEKTALDSVYSLFSTTRNILHRNGRKTINFSKTSIPILNQVVRPFTAKWLRDTCQGHSISRMAARNSETIYLRCSTR